MTTKHIVPRLIEWVATAYGVEKRLIEDRKGTAFIKMRCLIATVAMEEGGNFEAIQEKFSRKVLWPPELAASHERWMEKDTMYNEVYRVLKTNIRDALARFYSSENVYDYIPRHHRIPKDPG